MDYRKKAKSKVLDQIMQLMDEKIVGEMKSKSPKFKAMEVSIDDEVEDDGSVSQMSVEEEPSEDEKEQIRKLYEKFCK